MVSGVPAFGSGGSETFPIYGQAFSGDAVHSVWTYNDNNQWAVLITGYQSDPDLRMNRQSRMR